MLVADEFAFEEYVGLVNKTYDLALPMHLVEVENKKTTVTIAAGALHKGVEIFSHKAVFQKNEALLVMSPWVRVDPGTPERLLEEFRRCSLSLAFHGAAVFGERPIGPYLLPYGPGQEPAYPGSLCHVPTAYNGYELDLKSGTTLSPLNILGAFLPTGTPVTVLLRSKDECPSEEVRVTAGLTCARYAADQGWDLLAFGEGTQQIQRMANEIAK
jgi:hypothetical protein